MITITTNKDRDPNAWKADREALFSIDGTEYTIPKAVPPNVALEAVELVSRMGEVAGTRELMVMMLGRAGWDALRTCGELAKEDLVAIQTAVRERVFGGMEEEGKG